MSTPELKDVANVTGANSLLIVMLVGALAADDVARAKMIIILDDIELQLKTANVLNHIHQKLFRAIRSVLTGTNEPTRDLSDLLSF